MCGTASRRCSPIKWGDLKSPRLPPRIFGLGNGTSFVFYSSEQAPHTFEDWNHGRTPCPTSQSGRSPWSMLPQGWSCGIETSSRCRLLVGYRCISKSRWCLWMLASGISESTLSGICDVDEWEASRPCCIYLDTCNRCHIATNCCALLQSSYDSALCSNNSLVTQILLALRTACPL